MERKGKGREGFSRQGKRRGKKKEGPNVRRLSEERKMERWR